MVRLVNLIVVLVLVALALSSSLPGGTANAAFVLRGWAVPQAAPANGDPLSTSAHFTMRSRVGGPAAGRTESESFTLWGCSAYTPVEFAFFASLTEPLCVTLRWTVESLIGIDGFNVYRSLTPDGSFVRINSEILSATSPGCYEDRSVWPSSEFWYELWAVYPGGSELKVTEEPVSVVTGGTLVTTLYAPSPNPFRHQAVIQFDIASAVGGVRLTVYDVSGRVVQTFEKEYLHPGRYSMVWDGANASGERVASGVYYCLLEAGGKRETRGLVFLK